jgi:hypothetical protein
MLDLSPTPTRFPIPTGFESWFYWTGEYVRSRLTGLRYSVEAARVLLNVRRT